jgi:hypothetical protein
MAFLLEMALSELVAGVFTLNSGLDGPDLLSDLGAFAGAYDDISGDVSGPIRVEAGTDSLASGKVLASTLTATVSRPDDPGYWNPNNPASPLNSVTPGFVPLRPGRLTVLTPAFGDNLCGNPGAETDATSGGVLAMAATITRDVVSFRSGSASFKVVT